MTAAHSTTQLVVPEHAFTGHIVRQVDQRIAEIVGDATLEAIERDLALTGIPITDPWVYTEMQTMEVGSTRFLLTRIISRTSYGRIMPLPTVLVDFAWQDHQRGYRLEMFGLAVDQDHPEEPVSAPWMWWLKGSPLRATVRRMRAISPAPLNVVALADWRPGWPAPTITPADVTHSRAAVRAYQTGRDLLLGVQAGPGRGRRPGGYLSDHASFWREVPIVILELLKRPGKQHDKAGRDETAEKLNIDPKRLKDLTHEHAGMDWPDFVKAIRNGAFSKG